MADFRFIHVVTLLLTEILGLFINGIFSSDDVHTLLELDVDFLKRILNFFNFYLHFIKKISSSNQTPSNNHK